MGDHVWVLVVLLLLVCLAAEVQGSKIEAFRRDPGHPQWHHGAFQDFSANVKQETHNMLHSRARVPFHVPLEVNIVLVGFNGDGGYRYMLEAKEFGDFMKKVFPSHRPGCLETGMQLDIEHELYYNVIPVGQPELITMEWEVQKAMVNQGTARGNEYGREVPLFEVEATKLEPLLNILYGYLFGYEADTHSNVEMNKPVPNAIFILNFDKVRMSPLKENASANIDISAPIRELTVEELLSQEAGYVYRYRYNGGAATQVWLSSGRYAVIDISAGPCTYGKVESEEGSVGYQTLPRLQNLLFPRRRDPVKKSDTKEPFRGHLSALIVSAIEHIISPDVRYEYIDTSLRLLVPVIIFRNHQLYNPLQIDGNANFSIDLKSIEAQVRRMVQPGQEVVVVGGVHNLHDHEKISMAVAKALRSHSVHESGIDGRFHARTRSYLDAALLREEMKHSADILASGLLDVSDPSASSRFFRKEGSMRYATGARDDADKDEGSVVKSKPVRWASHLKKKDADKSKNKKAPAKSSVETSYGTRVIPVFVLSLAGVSPDLLMDGENLMWTSSDSVFVLQHKNNSIPLSYVSETARREAVATSPQRHILAGLASVVGGLSAPYERASHIHERPIINWLWASGHHPFGPFSNTATVSQMLHDTALRNAIYSRVDMALRRIREANEKIQMFSNEFLRTPLGEPVKGKREKTKPELWIDKFYKKESTFPQPVPQVAIERLENYLDGLETQLVDLAALLYDHNLKDAFKNSTSVVRSALFTQDYVDHVLWKEKDNMKCCRVEYTKPVQSSQAFIYGGILVAGFVVYFLVIFFSSPER